MANLRMKVGLVGVLAGVALTLSLQKFMGINLTDYSTQLAVGVTLMTIGIGYWTFKPEIERVTSKIAIQETEENKERIEQHQKALNDAYLLRRNQLALHVWTWFETFQNFRDSKHFLQHICTGHPELYDKMKDLMSLEIEFKNIPKPIPDNLKTKAFEIKQKEDKLCEECKEKFDEWQDRIRQKIEDMGGICENCARFYNAKDSDFKELKSRLNSFTMPF